MRTARFGTAVLALVITLTTALTPGPALAASAAEIDRDVTRAIQDMYAKEPKSKDLVARSKGILVFPNIVKAGFMFGGQYGEGALRKGGRTVGYYNTVAASYGFQAGIQTYGYALIFMTDAALKYLNKSEGFELGTEHRRARQGRRRGHLDVERAERHVRDVLRPAGSDGRARTAGHQGQPNRQMIGTAPLID
jgi:hypothetical protein